MEWQWVADDMRGGMRKGMVASHALQPLHSICPVRTQAAASHLVVQPPG